VISLCRGWASMFVNLKSDHSRLQQFAGRKGAITANDRARNYAPGWITVSKTFPRNFFFFSSFGLYDQPPASETQLYFLLDLLFTPHHITENRVAGKIIV